MPFGVVVGYEQTSSSERALAEAAGEAARRGVALTVVHAFHHAPTSSPPYEVPAGDGTAPGSVAQDIAEDGAERVRARHPGLTVQPRSLAGSAPAVLGDQSSDADLLVVGHRGRGGFSGLRLGSVAQRTLARAGCPTMVVRGGEHAARGTVVAAVDIGDRAEEILDFAFTEAAQRGARLKAVSALEILWPRAYAGDTGQLSRASSRTAERAKAALARLLEPWRAKYPDVVTDHELVEGSPTAALTAVTTYSDLIVVGARRRGGGHQGMRVGPVAHTLLLHSDCPVAVVPHG
jgi:nucleotide-binding universal stress UspA family protein